MIVLDPSEWPAPLRSLTINPRGNVGRWAASGGMILTGRADGPPLAPPAPVADVLLTAGALVGVPDAAALVGERGLSRRGATSCGGATRLIRAADNWVAVGLPRAEDIAAVPAWVGESVATDDPWPAITAFLARTQASDGSALARLLEIPVAMLGELPSCAHPWVLSHASTGTGADRQPLVADLSTLWAGPLCGDLLQRSGARVVKIEDPRRPDGARTGPAPFFDRLNGAKETVSVDLHAPALGRLLDAADIIITSARPRAFEQLGIDVDAILSASPTVWIAVTAYGWNGPGRDRVGFGDDVAVAAGLTASSDGDPLFVADAVADPLCGTLAAAAALACRAAGGSWFVDASLAGAAAYTVALAETDRTRAATPMIGAGWTIDTVPVSPPRARPILRAVPPLGADTDRVLSSLK